MEILILYTIFAYLLGSASSSILITQLFHLDDPREHGSKNPGATNMLRINGVLFGLLTLTGDLSKGFFAIFLAQYLKIPAQMLPLIAFSTFFGHLFPIYYHFKGGKGVAVSLGIILALNWILALIAFTSWTVILISTRYSSLAAILTAPLTTLASIYFHNNSLTFTLALISFLLMMKHHNNIKNLYTGHEPKIHLFRSIDQ